MKDKLQSKLYIMLPLLTLALLCAVLLFIVNEFTHKKIQDNARIYKLRMIESVMSLPHDNDLYNDFIEVTDPSIFNTDQPVTVFRMRKGKQSIGVIFFPVIAKGYSGNIELTIGIAYDGTIMGVQVLKQHETEGMGDRIVPEKSDWLGHFTDHSLENTPLEAWTVSADGGQFDELSGATITSRGVVNAVRNTLEYYKFNRDKLYRMSINMEEE